MRLIQIVTILILVGNILKAQNVTQMGLLPRVNYVHPINDHFAANFTLFSEISLQEKEIETAVFESQVLNFTFVGNLSYKLGRNNIVSGGYLFRINTPLEDNAALEHRFIQQFIHIDHIQKLRIRHIVRIEERFIESRVEDGDFTDIIRLSYTLGWDLPLQGQRLDVGEVYLHNVNGIFFQPTEPRSAFHNLTEIYVGLGYQTRKWGRVEVGPEFKMNVRNTNKDLRTLAFIDIIWYPDFKR